MSKASSQFVATGSWGAFGLVIGINILIALLIFIIFWILRAKVKKTKYFFAPEYYNQQSTTDPLPSPGTGFFSWLSPVFGFSEADMLRMRGLDAVLFLRVIKMMMLIFALFIVFGVGVLIAVNFTAPQYNQTSSEEENIRGVPQISIANIVAGSNRLYVHSVIAWIFTAIVLYMTYRFWTEYAVLRTAWMQTQQSHNYTVMYKADAPLSQHPDQFFRQRFPETISDVQFSAEANELRKITDSWKKVNKNLFLANLALQNTQVRPTHRLRPIIGDKVDSINFYTAQLEELSKIIERERAKLIQNNPVSTVGFVTFKDIGTAYQHAREQKIRATGYRFTAEPAPQPTDVFWAQLTKTRNHRRAFTPVVYAIILLLVIFWGAITVFAQGIVNLQHLALVNGFHWLSGVLNWNAALTGLITGFLPPLIVQILFSLVPKIMGALVKLRGVYTMSELHRTVAKFYFIFLVVNVFIVSIIAGGALWVLYDLVNGSPQSNLALLGQGVPAQATFFINYVIVYGILTNSMKMLNPGPLFISLVKSSRAKSPEAAHEAQKSKPFQYEQMYAVHLLIFVIGFTYSTIAPFILPWVVVYYCTSYLVSKYRLMYAMRPEFDSGGLFWPAIFSRMMFAVILSQLVMIGFFILKKITAWAVIIPLPIITLIFAIYMRRMFLKRTQYLPVDVHPQGESGDNFIHSYRDPVLYDDLALKRANPLASSAMLIKSLNDQDPEQGIRKPYAGYGAV